MSSAKSEYVLSREFLGNLTLSRRSALQAALAAALLPGIAGKPGFVAAQDDSPAVWNWGGNAGHTFELPGPGLDLDRSLGELWRIPGEEFWSGDRWGNRIAGYANDVIYTFNGESLWARRLSDGAFLWAQNPANVAAATSPEGTPASSDSDLSMSDWVAIYGDLVLVPMNNGRMWGLDAATGSLRWDVEWETADLRIGSVPPTIVGDLALSTSEQGISAFRLTDPPTIQWTVNVNGWLVGADAELVYLMVYDSGTGAPGIRALNLTDGSEYWRAALDPEIINAFDVAVLPGDGIALVGRQYDPDEAQLALINREGQIAWSISTVYAYLMRVWISDGMFTRLTEQQAQTDFYRLESMDSASGELNWTLDVDTNRWYASYNPVICDGKAYAFARDNDQGDTVLLIVDPVNADVRGARGLSAIPIFVADGILLTLNDDTNDISAFGPADPVLHPGGRATLSEDATLRGAPSDSAIERAQLTAGTMVLVTGASETANGTEWAPVTDQATGQSGWLPASVLTAQDGPVTFAPIDVNEFGWFTRSVR